MNCKIKGVSVIICCYNSAGRIRETLSALSRQQFYTPLYWEILLIDNASTDQTANAAREIWEGLDTGMTLRILEEPIPGLGNARKKGVGEAACTIVLFCDDDNWLSPLYVQEAFNILDKDRMLAACGGTGLPIFETIRPRWFDEYREAFAVGTQRINMEDGKLLNLYGAGLAVKTSVLEELAQNGFVPKLKDRVGKKLSSAGDTELSYALVLMGYSLHHSERLTFYHYIPKERLTFSYLKDLFSAFGSDGPIRNLYYANISGRLFHRRINNWYYHLMLSIFRLMKYFLRPPKKYGRVIYFRWSVAYIKELIAMRGQYEDVLQNIHRVKDIASAKIMWKHSIV